MLALPFCPKIVEMASDDEDDLADLRKADFTHLERADLEYLISCIKEKQPIHDFKPTLTTLSQPISDNLKVYMNDLFEQSSGFQSDLYNIEVLNTQGILCSWYSRMSAYQVMQVAFILDEADTLVLNQHWASGCSSLMVYDKLPEDYVKSILMILCLTNEETLPCKLHIVRLLPLCLLKKN